MLIFTLLYLGVGLAAVLGLGLEAVRRAAGPRRPGRSLRGWG